MSEKIIPGPAFLPPEPAVPTDTFGPAGSLFALPLTEPGDVADPAGGLWLDTFGDRLSHGELTVTPEQARAAAQHGWQTVPGSESDDRVTIRRTDPMPERD